MSEPKVVDLGNIRESIENNEPVYYDYYAKSEADKVISHHKYKRCVAMAKWCQSCRFAWSFIPEDDIVHKSDYFKKWEKRWLELAKKFKEAKL